MKKILLTFMFLVLAGKTFAGVTLSKKFGVELWKTDAGTFAYVQMGKEKWYLKSEQCIMNNGNCYFKFFVPSTGMFMDLSNGFLNFNALRYTEPFK